MNLNRVSLIGNLTRDPIARTLPSGQPLVRFGLATNHVWKDAKSKEKREQVEYHDIVAWGKLAEIVSQYVKKGSHIYLEGRLQTRSWKTKKGETRTTTEVVANNVIMLGHRAKPEASESRVEEQLAEEGVDVQAVPAEA